MFSIDIEKTFQRAFILLFAVSVVAFSFCGICLWRDPPYVPSAKKQTDLSSSSPLFIPCDFKEKNLSLSFPKIEGEISFSLNRSGLDLPFLLRLKKNGQTKYVTLPSRVYFHYDKTLQFSSEEGPFWVDFSLLSDSRAEASVFISDVLENKFTLTPEESPLRLAHELTEGSCFRFLAEGKFLGKDLFLEKYGASNGSYRLDVGGVVFLKSGDLLFFDWGKWEKKELPKEILPTARVATIDDKGVVFEVWGVDEYVRLFVPSGPASPLKIKGDELLSAVRIRSEKQLSCMLEKQCFILRAGDLVLKENNRWKVLRKKEEKEAYLQGKSMGELFVFDQIGMKGGQKIVQGHLVNLERSLLLPVEVSLQKKEGKGK